MRNVADYSSLADIILIRRLISLSFLIPLPADAVVTPITFLVPRHTGNEVARGFLRWVLLIGATMTGPLISLACRELDLVESGNRELSGEWVVGTDVWKRLKASRRARRQKTRPLSVNRTPLAKSTGREGFEDPESTTPISIDTPDTTDSGNTSDATKDKAGVSERVIYYIHGGAYYVGNAATHRLVTIGVSKACNARVFGEQD